MKTYDASLIKVIEETEHYAKIFHPAIKQVTVSESIYFLEWLRSIGYRYLRGDGLGATFVICEKLQNKVYLVTDCSGYALAAYSSKELAESKRLEIKAKSSSCVDDRIDELPMNGERPE